MYHAAAAAQANRHPRGTQLDPISRCSHRADDVADRGLVRRLGADPQRRCAAVRARGVRAGGGASAGRRGCGRRRRRRGAIPGGARSCRSQRAPSTPRDVGAPASVRPGVYGRGPAERGPGRRPRCARRSDRICPGVRADPERGGAELGCDGQTRRTWCWSTCRASW